MEIEHYSKDSELIIGLVCPVGVNLDDVHNRLESLFRQTAYDLNLIHLSELTATYFTAPAGLKSEHARLDLAMNNGNALRRRSKRADVYALVAINDINKRRSDDDGVLKPLGRVVHVIRSLKHPDEVETLRQVYGHGFFLVGISSTIESRKRYLQDVKGIPEAQINRLIARDDKENDPFGQSTRDVFQMADAFITSDSTDLSEQLSRMVDILFSKPVSTPTSDEYAMFLAYAASLRSGDLSRQVGAVIANEHCDIVATGANDVPKHGGGLYWPDESDERDYKKGKDSNESQKDEIILNVMKRVGAPGVSDEDLLAGGKRLLKDTGLLDITEYGRAVHAEMEALLSCARNGISTRNATLYTTTFPCHNCAKHIVAAGIKKVIYIEPYPKSYAAVLHSDSIESVGAGGADKTQKVQFEPFVGIGPRRFVDLFSMSLGNGRKLKRKEAGKLKAWCRPASELRVPMSPLSYIDSETILARELGAIDLKETDHGKLE
jgi:deoxycytidylate deaminase